jgi:hypothetical protein
VPFPQQEDLPVSDAIALIVNEAYEFDAFPTLSCVIGTHSHVKHLPSTLPSSLTSAVFVSVIARKRFPHTPPSRRSHIHNIAPSPLSFPVISFALPLLLCYFSLPCRRLLALRAISRLLPHCIFRPTTPNANAGISPATGEFVSITYSYSRLDL